MGIRAKLRIRSRIRSVIYRIRPPEPRPLILTYHRIADEPVDYFRLAVAPDHFEEQLEVLRRTRQPRPLDQFVSELVDGTLPSNAVALTFDDGYVDNLLVGKPRLEAADMPATVFLITGYIDSPERLWWDTLVRLILFGSCAQGAEIVIGQKVLRFDLDGEAPAFEDGTTRARLLTKRHAALWALRQALRVVEDEERRGIMIKLQSMFAWDSRGTDVVRAMTTEEVRTLLKDGLVKVGAHTVTHPVLPELAGISLDHEIGNSKSACEALSGGPVASFAYPYGDFDDHSRDAVMTAGFAYACGTRKAPATAASDTFALPRIHVPDVGGDAFEQTLRAASAIAR